jgi:hydrogenase nickel incorporation protein HypA/HybF
MHEGSIAESILNTLEERIADGRIPGRVRVIHLRVGRLMAVVPENLHFLFDIMAKGTPLEGARIEIENIPVHAACGVCGADFEISDVYFLCPVCNSGEIRILTGKELAIEDVEVD